MIVKERTSHIKGVNVEGDKIDMIRFPDDIAVLTNSEDELLEILAETKVILGPRNNMKINKRKTITLLMSRQRTRANLSVANSREEIWIHLYLVCG